MNNGKYRISIVNLMESKHLYADLSVRYVNNDKRMKHYYFGGQGHSRHKWKCLCEHNRDQTVLCTLIKLGTCLTQE